MNNKTLVISGGSGNEALVTALVDKKKDFNILLNLYDNGKSTGICREITDTLGVSDARKNQFRLYKLLHKDNLDDNLVKFYSSRIDINSKEDIYKFLEDCKLTIFNKYIDEFFNIEKAKNYEYKDFSIVNIIYSILFKKIGYKETLQFFSIMLDIPNNILINSLTNAYIMAITENNKLISDEGDIVEYKNLDDKIRDIMYAGTINEKYKDLDIDALVNIDNADTIIISTGTFWSSIYPTLQFNNLYKFINESNAKKIWIMNSEEDKDSYGVSSNEFIERFEKLGLDLSDFTIVENLDATSSLQEHNNKYNIKYYHLGNNNGKNDSNLLAKVVDELC